MNERLYHFAGGDSGSWRITRITAIKGEPLAPAERLNVAAGAPGRLASSAWVMSGVTSNERYVTRDEKTRLVAKQPVLGRAEATCAALIPLRKNAEWWALTQDERRRIFEEQSAHIEIGMKYLPAVARKLHHCRDLAEPQPFDFVTWFEFAPADAGAFDELLAALRASPEWRYVDREVEIRVDAAQ